MIDDQVSLNALRSIVIPDGMKVLARFSAPENDPTRELIPVRYANPTQAEAAAALLRYRGWNVWVRGRRPYYVMIGTPSLLSEVQK